ncbi:nuclear exosome regulator NRDE2 [Ornithorhynchus anatinus]|uniref:nuclear exosome regulator NRDE2 n=1 Tax=Ornithorhynchus anatinus TaxID=9258 RepID=UPI0019D4BBF0|nr:nuclear exosome regulator NRDE2 [Ornithorhynchus anatinus]
MGENGRPRGTTFPKVHRAGLNVFCRRHLPSPPSVTRRRATEPGTMALFPAFAAASQAAEASAGGAPRRELDWLSNPSFCPEVAPLLHQHAEETAVLPKGSPPIRHPLTSELSEDSDANKELRHISKKQKKEKKKRKKHRHHKKTRKNHGQSSSSELDADSDFEKDKAARNVRDSQKKLEKPNQDNEAAGVVGSHLVWLEDVQALTAETFRIDKKPDPANWEYKSLYRGDIARFKRKGDSCLGINPKKQCISWEGATTKKKHSHKQVERYFTKSSVRLLSTDGVALCSKNKTLPPEPGSFIAVKETEEVPSPATTCVNPLGVYDKSTTLWLQGRGPQDNEAQEPVPQKDDANSHLGAKVEEFNRKVRENPWDITLWMDFVSFQDELMKGPSLYTTGEGKQTSRKNSLKFILEKKLAILERAIESNPNNIDLKLAKLKLCTELWEPSTLIKEWQKLIFLHPNNAALWQKYLLFCQSQFSTFSVSKIHNLYGKCLSTLAAVQDGSIVSHPALPGTEEAMFALFVQHCHFLRQTGYSEKAVSLFQAMIDFTFFKPDSVKDLSTRRQVEFFEPFWDSGEPRVGEKGARGWRAWMHQQERGGWIEVKPDEDEDDDPEEDDEEIKDKTLPKWQIWLNVERSRERRHWLPWRPDKTKKQTDEDCEDPERQVLFDDLEESLIQLSSPELKFQLLISFLQFLGVPSKYELSTSCLYLAMDESSIFENGLSDDKPLTFLDLLFSGVSCIGHMDMMNRRQQLTGHCREGEEFIQNVFCVILPLFSGTERSHLCFSWLQYEISKLTWNLQIKNKKKLKFQGKKCKKLAKNLLKEPENRNNLSLWKQFAHLEWLLGNTEDARKVFDTAISMIGTEKLKNSSLCDLSLLYAELEVELLENLDGAVTSRAVHILTHLTENGPFRPYSGQVLAVNILKARKAYEHALHSCWSTSLVSNSSSNCLRHLISLVGCFALFQYLTVGIDAAVVIYKQTSEKLKELISEKFPSSGEGPGVTGLTRVLETVTLMHTNLLRYHMKVSIYPLNPLREALTEAIKLYPGNHALWRSYIHIQKKSHHASKTRRFFDDINRYTKSLEPMLFAIQAEKMRKKLVETVQRLDTGEIHSTIPETGLTNRIKVLFDNATQEESGTHCPLLWRMYLHFLVSLGDKKGTGIFYRSLQSCPWAKVLYMDAVEYFPDQLQVIIDLMTEKELRVRLPLEELELLLED